MKKVYIVCEEYYPTGIGGSSITSILRVYQNMSDATNYIGRLMNEIKKGVVGDADVKDRIDFEKPWDDVYGFAEIHESLGAAWKTFVLEREVEDEQ